MQMKLLMDSFKAQKKKMAKKIINVDLNGTKMEQEWKWKQEII